MQTNKDTPPVYVNNYIMQKRRLRTHGTLSATCILVSLARVGQTYVHIELQLDWERGSYVAGWCNVPFIPCSVTNFNKFPCDDMLVNSDS